jgi:hypothetical protein
MRFSAKWHVLRLGLLKPGRTRVRYDVGGGVAGLGGMLLPSLEYAFMSISLTSFIRVEFRSHSAAILKPVSWQVWAIFIPMQ